MKRLMQIRIKIAYIFGTINNNEQLFKQLLPIWNFCSCKAQEMRTTAFRCKIVVL